MKEIKAYIHKHRIAAVIDALKASDAAVAGQVTVMHNINVTSVQSLAAAVNIQEQRFSMDLAQPVIGEFKLELLCEDAECDRVLGIIVDNAYTGQGDSGWVYVTDIHDARRITKRPR